MIFNPFSVLTSKIFAGIAAAALIFGAVQTVRIEGLKIWPIAIEGYAAANTRLAVEISQIKAAQITATAMAWSARAATELNDAEAARKADHESAEINSLRAAAERFAVNRRLHPQAVGGPPGTANPSSEGDPAQNRDGPGVDAVVLTKHEYDEYVEISLRLKRVHDWGQTLIDEKRAIPEVEFSPTPEPTDK